jgi:hypothetical protein
VALRVSRGWGRGPVGDVGDFGLHDPPALGRRCRFGLGHLLTVVRAGLRRWSLDAALARGANPCESPTLAYRAARLTSRRGRVKLAASVDGVLAAAARPAPGLSSAVRPCREEVASAASLLIEVGALLRSTSPVYCGGVAMVGSLLRDGGSPLYLPGRRGALKRELEVILAALEGGDQGEDI